MRGTAITAGLALCAALIGASLGCVSTGVSLEDLSPEPIALVYWDPESARRRAELLDEMTNGSSGSGRYGVARLDDVASLVTPDRPQIGSAARLRQFPGRLVLYQPRTGEITPIESAPPNARPLAWSPDHRQLLYSSSHLDGGTTQLFQYDLETGEVRKVTHGPDHHPEGAYSPDGQLAVTWIRIERNRRMAGLDIRSRSGGVGELILAGLYPSDIGWSPKGGLLVYVHADNRTADARRDQSQIVIQKAEPGAPTQSLARGRESVFSPDGEWIVYTTQSGKIWRLARMRPDGSARRLLGKSSRHQRNPAVSPDSRHVAYVSKQGNIDHLYLRRMDGSGDRLLLSHGSVAFPVW